MEFIQTDIADVLLIKPKAFRDDRGFFMETYESSMFAEHGIDAAFIQDNHSGSQQGTLRGLHYQIRYSQGKLVRVIAGEVFDVAVDLRKSSPDFGKWVGISLSAENKNQLWVPPGFAHGFYVVSEWAELVYKVTNIYAPEWERCLAWDDEQVGVRWPIPAGGNPILSEKDQYGSSLKNAELFD